MFLPPENILQPMPGNQVGTAAFGCPAERELGLPLPLRLTARQLLDLRLFRASGVITRLFRLLCFSLFARGAAGFLAFFFAQCLCICHEFANILFCLLRISRARCY